MPAFNEKKFEIEEDLRTLRRAREIEASTKRMKNVKKLAMEESKVLAKITKGKK